MTISRRHTLPQFYVLVDPFWASRDPNLHGLDEYTVKFPDDSTANLYQYQLVEITSID